MKVKKQTTTLPSFPLHGRGCEWTEVQLRPQSSVSAGGSVPIQLVLHVKHPHKSVKVQNLTWKTTWISKIFYKRSPNATCRISSVFTKGEPGSSHWTSSATSDTMWPSHQGSDWLPTSNWSNTNGNVWSSDQFVPIVRNRKSLHMHACPVTQKQNRTKQYIYI